MLHESKEITRDEARYLLLTHLASLVDYWENESRATESKKKLEGLLFSVLSALDGCSCGLPGFMLIPSLHESDKEYAIENHYDYYPHLDKLPEGTYDIGGSLHEQIHKYLDGSVERPKNLRTFNEYVNYCPVQLREMWWDTLAVPSGETDQQTQEN